MQLVEVTKWILGSARVAPPLAPPVDDDPMGVSANRQGLSIRRRTSNNFAPPVNRFAAFQR
ncbi:hypothetical protein MPL3356_40085 [Mesorhizobium plurifarium]|uniref:Uncharacterized protein n=1 Tax=Mesorhizobium plurifarium TaxID=69974 RepID=A0A090E071_MESPL|nr:hypothetical protein MPL3356_40085 [Mesorhizobium plurifarium]